MPNQFFSPEGDLENYFVSEYWLLEQYVNSKLWTWGLGTSAQLGDNTNTSKSTPVTTFSGGTTWKQVSAGDSHTTAIKTDGTLWTWGRGNEGQLGDNTTTTRSTPVTTFSGGTNWKQVSSGGSHIAAIKTDGTLWTWGQGSSGQLGTNDATQRNTPVTTFSGGTNWKQVSSGDSHTTAIKTDGTLWTWGLGTSAQLGDNTNTTRSTPVTTLSGGTTWKQVSAGGNHTAAIKTDGTLWIWGNNTNGQLGNNNLILSITGSPTTTFAGGTDWKQVSAGNAYTSAVKTDGTLWTWGNNDSFQLGRIGSSAVVPVTTFAGGTNWADTSTTDPAELYTLSAGNYHTAAIKTDGTLWTWGNGSNAQLGDNTNTTKSTPVTTFAGGTTWKQVSGGGSHTAAVKTDGTLWTWGNNGFAQLGDNTITTKSTPVTTFSGGTNWKQVSAGGDHTAAIKTDGTLWIWGNNTNGQLGNNNLILSITGSPTTTFAGGTDWKQVSAGNAYTSAVKTDGTLWTWGNNDSFQLGRIGSSAVVPVTTFAGGTNWADTSTTDPAELYTLSAGNYHTAAIKTDGTLWTWGLGTSAQLGDNTTTTRSTPVTTFTGGTNWKQISCGGLYTAAIKTDGTLWTWGYNGFAQLGDNTTTQRNTPVTTFTGGTTWQQISSGGSHTAAVKTDGTLWTWGNNGFAQLGDNTITQRNTPVTTFAGGTNWKQVSAGGSHTAAVKTDGTLWTWGRNANAQLGDNTTTQRNTPVTTFAGGTNWKQVSSGGATTLAFTAAVKTDGTLWVWGNNNFGQIGDNTITQRNTPVTTFSGGTNWKQVSCGNLFSVAVKTDGTLWTWGYDNQGQLGTSDTTNRSTPVTTFAGGTTWKQVSAGDSHTVALSDDGINKELYVFGNNNFAQLGINANLSIPSALTGTNWKQVSAGYRHTAAVKTDGTLWTWGNNSFAQLGTNDTTTRYAPVTTFAGGTNWKQVSSGYRYTAAVKTDGTLWTWGFNGSGQLGINANTTRSTPVTTFAGGTTWKQVSASSSIVNAFMAAVKTDGTLWTWGSNLNGQIGDNTTTTKSTPVTTFSGGTNWKQVSAGDSHTVALTDDGTNKELYVFGNNTNAQLGINQTYFAPAAILGTIWKQVSSGYNCTAAMKTDGTLWTWGNNTNGKLGTNDITNRFTPVTTFAGGTDWKQVSSGRSHITATSIGTSVDVPY